MCQLSNLGAGGANDYTIVAGDHGAQLHLLSDASAAFDISSVLALLPIEAL